MDLIHSHTHTHTRKSACYTHYRHTGDSQITPVVLVIQPRAGRRKKKKKKTQSAVLEFVWCQLLLGSPWLGCKASNHVLGVTFMFEVWFFLSFWWNNVFDPTVPMTQAVLWALTLFMPFQETQGKQHFSFLPNDHISGCSTSSCQQGSVCHYISSSSLLFLFFTFFTSSYNYS